MKNILIIVSLLFSIITQAQLPGTLVINPYQNSACVGSTVSITGYLALNNSGCNQIPWSYCGNYNFTLTPDPLPSTAFSAQYFTINVTSSVAGTINYNLQISNLYVPQNGLPAGSLTTGTTFSVTFVAPTTNPIGSITGASTVCQSQNNVVYTVPPVSNASSYTWTLPSGATGSSTTNSISVNYGSNAVSGNITVKANYSSCNTTNIASYPITVTPNLLSLGIITGNTSINPPQNQVTYSVNAIPNATSYIWSLPNGFTGTSSTNSITATIASNAESGNVTVKGVNSCFQSPVSSLPVNLNSNYPPYLENIPLLSGSVGTPIPSIIPVNTGSPVFPSGVNTIAGQAKVNHPAGITKDSSGNVYFADSGNHRIRKIALNSSPPYNSIISTLEGSDQGYVDGSGKAKFNDPNGIAVDPSGTIYIADSGNHRIRKISPSGIVSTIAGSTQGFLDGIGTSASFNYPTGIVVDASGDLYVTDSGNHRIRKITSAGVVSTFAGSTQGYLDGLGTTAQFYTPYGICKDISGNLYVTDAENNRIRKISITGMVSTIAGSVQGDLDGIGVNALFNYPTGIDIDSSGTLYITDSNNNKLRRVTSTGIVSSLIGPESGAPGQLILQLNRPMGFTILPGSPYDSYCLTDFNYNRILFGFLLDNKNNNVIGSIDPLTLSDQGNTDGITHYIRAFGITAKPNEKDIYISSDACQGFNGACTVKKMTPLGVITDFVQPGFTSGDQTNLLESPVGLSSDLSGNLYVAEIGKNRIRKVTPSGAVSTFAGSITSGSADGIGISAQFNQPYGTAVDASGNVYVADSENHRIRKITPARVVSTFAGSTQGYLDGIGTSAQFKNPYKLAIDANGNVYVTDNGNFRVRKITPTGVVSTFAGSTQGYLDGLGTTAKFTNVTDLSFDNDGNLFVADGTRIRKITPSGLVSTFAGSGISGSSDGPLSTAQVSPFSLVHDKIASLYFIDDGGPNIKRISIGYSISPALPAGLNFDSATGAITGTPTVSIPSTTYTITGYNEYGTSTTSVVISINVLGITEFVVDKLKIYPNPTDSVLNLSVNDGIILDKAIIVDITGKVVLEQTENLSTINVEKLSKGIYILIANSGDKKYQEKFIKE